MNLLIQSFVAITGKSTDLRYNLLTYGQFVQDIPRRLGRNDALDTSVRALVSAHSSFCATRKVSVEAINDYSRALNSLRTCLDDPVKATDSHTLCAVTLLLMCQVSSAIEDNYVTGADYHRDLSV